MSGNGVIEIEAGIVGKRGNIRGSAITEFEVGNCSNG